MYIGGCKSVSTAFIPLWCYLQPDSITTRTHRICQHSVFCVYTCDIVCSQTASLEGLAGSVSTAEDGGPEASSHSGPPQRNEGGAIWGPTGTVQFTGAVTSSSSQSSLWWTAQYAADVFITMLISKNRLWDYVKLCAWEQRSEPAQFPHAQVQWAGGGRGGGSDSLWVDAHCYLSLRFHIMCKFLGQLGREQGNTDEVGY